MGTVQKVEILKIFWNIQICIFLIFGGSKNLKILKSSETFKSAFFSFGGSAKNMYIPATPVFTDGRTFHNGNRAPNGRQSTVIPFCCR